MSGLVSYKRRAEGVKFEGEVFKNLDLRSMKAFGSTWTTCTFQDCLLDLTDWRTSKFENCRFLHCKMQLVNFATSFFEKVRFVLCDLEQSSFLGAHFRNVEYDECRLAYGETMFQDVTVKDHAGFIRSNLHGTNLDFREVEPRSLYFDGCNLWGAKLSMGCAIWNGTFDDRTVRQFLALVARVSDDPRIAEMAGDQHAVVCRAMDGSPTDQTVTSTSMLPVTAETRSGG